MTGYQGLTSLDGATWVTVASHLRRYVRLTAAVEATQAEWPSRRCVCELRRLHPEQAQIAGVLQPSQGSRADSPAGNRPLVSS